MCVARLWSPNAPGSCVVVGLRVDARTVSWMSFPEIGPPTGDHDPWREGRAHPGLRGPGARGGPGRGPLTAPATACGAVRTHRQAGAVQGGVASCDVDAGRGQVTVGVAALEAGEAGGGVDLVGPHAEVHVAGSSRAAGICGSATQSPVGHGQVRVDLLQAQLEPAQEATVPGQEVPPTMPIWGMVCTPHAVPPMLIADTWTWTNARLGGGGGGGAVQGVDGRDPGLPVCIGERGLVLTDRGTHRGLWPVVPRRLSRRGRRRSVRSPLIQRPGEIPRTRFPRSGACATCGASAYTRATSRGRRCPFQNYPLPALAGNFLAISSGARVDPGAAQCGEPRHRHDRAAIHGQARGWPVVRGRLAQLSICSSSLVMM